MAAPPTKVARTSGHACADQRSKLEALTTLRQKLPYISQSALSAVLTELLRAPLPFAASRRDIRLARRDIARQMTPFGPLVQEVDVRRKDGAVFNMPIQHPWAMLHFASEHCCNLSRIIEKTCISSPCTPTAPWDLILYSDEITPGNQLKPDNSRKTWAVYYAFAQYGAEALQNEDVWLVATLIRAPTIEHIAGGMSAVMGAILKVFYSRTSHNMQTAGILLHLGHNNSLVRVFTALGGLLADEDAIHQMWVCKGSSGNKPCLVCLNVVSRDWHAKHVRSSDSVLVSHTNTNIAQLQLHTNATVRHIINELAVAKTTLSNQDLKDKETRLGWKHVPGNMLLDEELNDIVDPSKHNIYDWMHCYLVGGLFNIQVGLMMIALKPSGFTYASLHDFVQGWKWPQRVEGKAATGRTAMNPKRAAGSWKKGTFTCQASEALSLYPVIAFWVLTVLLPSGLHPAECAAFLLLAEVLDLILASARGGISPARLQAAIVRHLDAFKDAFGEEYLPPKGHYVLHLAQYLIRFAYLLNCLVHERKHKTIKRFTNALENIQDSTIFSVLEEVTCHALHHLDDESSGSNLRMGLIGGTQPSPHMLHILQAVCPNAASYSSARKARFSSYGKCSSGDVVMYRSDDSLLAGLLQFNGAADGIVVHGVAVWA